MEAPDFFVEDLLDLPNGDDMMPDAFFDNTSDSLPGNSSPTTVVDSSNSGGTDKPILSDLPKRSFSDSPELPNGELCVPYSEMAELEWLSNFVEESEGSYKGGAAEHSHQERQSSPCSGSRGKVRSKISRVAPSDWSTRMVTAHPKEDENKEIRRCLHCSAEKTPQWRTGPMGPKTLCNACGVRYKSGRLVPEYRPAASPTFVSARHSNSHRKVMELRRQKEGHYLVHPHHHMGSDTYRQQLI